MIYAGHSHEQDVPRIGWALLGAAANVTSKRMTPQTVRSQLTNPNAILALQLLAVDQHETRRGPATA